MNLSDAIQKSAEWINKCNEQIDSVPLNSDEKTRVVAALFHLSLEHHGSIHQLVLLEHYGSAFALLRPQFEAHIRGLWFQRSATKEQLKSFTKDNEPPTINWLLQKIEEIPEFSEGVLSSFKRKIWSVLCSFTHGGYVQVSWRMTSKEIKVDFKEDHLVSLITTSSSMSLLTYNALAVLADNTKLAISITESHKKIFGYDEWKNK